MNLVTFMARARFPFSSAAFCRPPSVRPSVCLMGNVRGGS